MPCASRRKNLSNVNHPRALSLGLLALAFGTLIDGCCLGKTFEVQKCVSGLEKEDGEVFGFMCLEDDSFGYLVDYFEGKEHKDF